MFKKKAGNQFHQLTSIRYAIARGIVEELKLKIELQPTA
jgi:hypothetical protein